MCTEINIEDFSTIHHEMGHIEYFMAYENQPAIYRAGANSAFHEAVGDTISLSVMSRKHLETIGLLKQDDIDSGTQRKSKFRIHVRSMDTRLDDFLVKGDKRFPFFPYGKQGTLYGYQTILLGHIQRNCLIKTESGTVFYKRNCGCRKWNL